MSDRLERSGRYRSGSRGRGRATELHARLARVPSRPLWLATLLVVAGDLATTIVGLRAGLVERNPVVADVLASHGAVGLVGLKLLTLAGAALAWTTVKRHYAVAAMIGIAVPQAVAVVLNVATIAIFLT